MLTKTEQKVIKRIVGRGYAGKIAEQLKSKKIFNRFGKPYSDSHIRQFMNGHEENINVENAIIDFANDLIKQSEARAKKRKKLL